MGMQIHPRCRNTKITPAYVNQPFQPDSFLVLKLGDVDIYFDGESQIDELIKAVCDGKETWRKYRAAHEPQPPQGEHPYPVRRCRFHGGDGKDGCTLCDEEREVAAREQAAGHPYPEFSVDAMLSAAGVRPAAPPQGEHPYPDAAAPRYGYAPDSPLARYDREAHLTWYQQNSGNKENWPKEPLTDDEALAAIAEYEPASTAPPHHARETEDKCGAYDEHKGEGWLCGAQARHDGPDHVAFGLGRKVLRTWPAEEGGPQCPDGRELEDGTIRHCRRREGHDLPHRDAGLNAWIDTDPDHRPDVHPRVADAQDGSRM